MAHYNAYGEMNPIAYYRYQLGLSQMNLALASQVTPQTIWRMEKGDLNIRLDTVILIAGALQRPLGQFCEELNDYRKANEGKPSVGTRRGRRKAEDSFNATWDRFAGYGAVDTRGSVQFQWSLERYRGRKVRGSMDNFITDLIMEWEESPECAAQGADK